MKIGLTHQYCENLEAFKRRKSLIIELGEIVTVIIWFVVGKLK